MSRLDLWDDEALDRQLAADFDGETARQPEDGAIAARLVDAALALST